MKKVFSLLRWPCLLQDVLNKTFTVQNKPAAVAPKETMYRFFVSGIGRRKLSMQPKFVAAQKMFKNRNPANIRKWIARVLLL